MNMLDVISKLNSKTRQVQIAEALFGGVGGKATNALAANLEGLYENIVLANDASKMERLFKKNICAQLIPLKFN